MTPLHFGELHPYETWLALALAFGPFLVLALVVLLRRRQAIAQEATEGAAEPAESERPSPPATDSTRSER